MASLTLPIRPLSVVALSLFIVLPLALAVGGKPAALTYHNGPILNGNVNLVLLWYGPFARVQKRSINSFLKSLNFNGGGNLQPQVSSWWQVVESYQSVARKGNGKIQVNIAATVNDPNYSIGKILNQDFIRILVQKVAKPNTVVVILASRQVTVQGTCMGKCSQHGAIGNQPYIIVQNPEYECPGECAWPFHKSDSGPQGVVFTPPSGNVGADAMVISLASGLAETVTNPFNTGFFTPGRHDAVEATTACPAMFGTGAFPGNAGKVRIDPKTGGAFNAHGVKGRQFLLPALWNPKTSSCWTPL
ncbi:protein EXORDIUM-like [Quillaja saponaria]|uniref:Protein EXORDIUM-like n=1 Tax=Quillaja saponaria TaxID=32244 RepID=A0AAD7LZL6_QUISA|nr:protein EXORDIUM-like [Quillaja saponaria]